ncbi:unnamed protein product [Phytomonas sp. EM1]|nr:unnamed protein product [Phytomonas sp. EM1]|eukprot:CCW60137.1 unnamed protein product [Phytomonas sp. isolate EM1]
MPYVKVYRRLRKSEHHYSDDSSYESKNSHRNRDHSVSFRRHAKDHALKQRSSSHRERSASRRRHHEDYDHAPDSHHNHPSSKRSIPLDESPDHPDEDFNDTPKCPLRREDTQPPRSRTPPQNRTPERINPIIMSSGPSPRYDANRLDSRKVPIRDGGSSVSGRSLRPPLRAQRNGSASPSTEDRGEKRRAADSSTPHRGHSRSSRRSQPRLSSREPIVESSDHLYRNHPHSRSSHPSTRDIRSTEERAHAHLGGIPRTVRFDHPYDGRSSSRRQDSSRHSPHQGARSRDDHREYPSRRSHRDPYARETETEPRYIVLYNSFNNHYTKDDHDFDQLRFPSHLRSPGDWIAWSPTGRQGFMGVPFPMGAPDEGLKCSPTRRNPRARLNERDATFWRPHSSFDESYSTRRTSRGDGVVERGWRRDSDPPLTIDGPESSSQVSLLRHLGIQQVIEETRDWLEDMKYEIEEDARRSRCNGRSRDSARSGSFHRSSGQEEEPLRLRNLEGSEVSSMDAFHRRQVQAPGKTDDRVHKERDIPASDGHRDNSKDTPARKLSPVVSQTSSSMVSDSMETSKHSVVSDDVEAEAVAAPSLTAPPKSNPPISASTTSTRRSKAKESPSQPTPVVNNSFLNDPIFSFSSFMDGNTFDTTEALCQYNVKLAEALSDDDLDLMRKAVFQNDESAFAELLYADDIRYELDLINVTLHKINDLQIRRDMHALSMEAVRQFNKKCRTAQKAIILAGQGLPEAIQRAASCLEQEMYPKEENALSTY